MGDINIDDLINDIARAITARASKEELTKYYFDEQHGYINSLDYEDIIELADIYLIKFNIEDYRKE